MASVEQFQALVGQEIGVSDWITIDQDRIDRFADATGDDQFIHVDPARAAATPFGGTIAHGFLTLSLYAVMRATSRMPVLDDVRVRLNYGGNKVRFVTPVRSGARVRGRFTLLEFAARGEGRWQETLAFTVEIDGADKPALVAEWLTQVLV
jgi:acyl dehydratase